MKKLIALFIMGVFMTIASQAVYAGTATLTITAEVPAANDVGFFVSRVTGVPPNVNFDTPILGSQSLDFGTLTFDPDLGIFSAGHYYAIDVGGINTATTPPTAAAGQVGNVQLTYVDGTPNGLGNKAITTFVKVVGAPGSQEETVFARHTLNSSNVTISNTSFAGGFLRIYLGVYNGDVFAEFPVEATGEPFTPTDAPGDYTGILTLTATLV